VADPPWSYRNVATGGDHQSGAAQHYPVMSTMEIMALPVHRIIAQNAVLFLWATVPLLTDAFSVMHAWYFDYKTALFWDKDRFGLGYWFRGQVEVCLIGVRGRVKPFRLQQPNLIRERPQRHSRKPDGFWNLIESVTPAPRVELFAREERPGWERWGNETNSTISLHTTEADS
jgi:N6-adenosine-specific RNA methylase IME4